MIELYSDDSFVFVHKPAGVPFHTIGSLEGFVSRVKRHFATDCLFPVHRLDQVTSGVMVFAKSQSANSELSQLFENRLVSKTYLALSDRKPSKKQGWIKGDMRKSRDGCYRLARTMDNPAITRFYARKLSPESPHWLFVLYPKTGKTHQLRVALKSLGSPILGDRRYKGNEHPRTCLHAYEIEFELAGKHYVVQDTYVESELLDGALCDPGCMDWLNSL